MLRFPHSADWQIDRHLRGGRSGGFSENEDALLLAEAQQFQNALDQCKQKTDSGNFAIRQQRITRFTKREVEISTLQIQLERLGAQGLEEPRSDIQQQIDHLQRRRNELKNRAKALDLLLELLREKHQILKCQIQALLQKQLYHYLNLIFPEAALTVDEHLNLEIISRQNNNGDLDSLSFGACEQMGLISRFVYADLLKEVGRPTLIILDDALAHYDAERLAQMERVGYQVLASAGGN